MRLEDLKAKCPRCGSKLSLDEMGTDSCSKCSKELRYDDMDTLIDLMTKILDQENEVIILKKGSIKTIDEALKHYTQTEHCLNYGIDICPKNGELINQLSCFLCGCFEETKVSKGLVHHKCNHPSFQSLIKSEKT